MTAETGIHIRWTDGELRAKPGDVVTFGRDPASTVVLDLPSVSRHHAELRFENGSWTVVDLGSTQGTHRQGAKVDQAVLTGATTVVFGHPERGGRVELAPDRDDRTEVVEAAPVPSAWAAPATELPNQRPGGELRSEQLAGATVVAGDTIHVSVGATSRVLTPGQSAVIGRDADCEIMSTNPTVSRRHANIHHGGSGWQLDDLGSTGGTFVDGHRTTSVPLTGSMAVWLGDAETGERVVVVASGERHVSAARKFDQAARKRAPLVVAGVAALAVVAVIIGVLALRNSDGGSVTTDALARATVRVLVNEGSGSGSVIDAKEGLILTNAHVVNPQAAGQALGTGTPASKLEKDPDTIVVALSPGLDRAAEVRFQATVVASDGYLDLAVIRITKTAAGAIVDAKDLAALTEIEVGDSDDVKTGDPIRVVGYPGVAGSAAPTVTDGQIASPTSDDRLKSNRAEFNTTAAVAPGNSGGVAVDKHGKLIGVPSAIVFDKATVSKVGIVRPVNFAKDLIAKARASEPYVSPNITPLTDEAMSGLRSVAAVSASGYAIGCESATAKPKPGDTSLTVAFDYTGFPTDHHQDVLFAVVANDKVVGVVESGGQYPFAWKGKGCATVTIPLASPLAPATDYVVTALVGPNYERTGATTKPFSVGDAAGPAPSASGPAPTAP